MTLLTFIIRDDQDIKTDWMMETRCVGDHRCFVSSRKL